MVLWLGWTQSKKKEESVIGAAWASTWSDSRKHAGGYDPAIFLPWRALAQAQQDPAPETPSSSIRFPPGVKTYSMEEGLVTTRACFQPEDSLVSKSLLGPLPLITLFVSVSSVPDLQCLATWSF